MGSRPMLAFGGFRRGGSSVGFMIMQHLLLESGLRSSDPVKALWDRGIPTSRITARQLLPEWDRNDVVGCFRAAPKLGKKTLAGIRLFLLVRDPRDCQTSWFHARHLHDKDAVPQVVVDKARLHEDLIENESFDADVTSLLDWCEQGGGRIHRYEDMVENPLGFIQAFQEFSGLRVTRSAIDLALIKAAFFQGSADPADHNRSGIPHEALRTLPDAELAALNQRFAPLLERLGYPLDRSAVPPLDLPMLVQRDAMKRYIHALADQNGQRIAEIQRLQGEIAALRDEVQMLRQSAPA